MCLCGSVIHLNALEDAWNNFADDVKGFLIAHFVEAHACLSPHFHLDEHDRLVWLLQFEDGCTAPATVETLAFHNIRHVFEAEIHLEVLLLHSFRDDSVELLVGMLEALDDATFFSEEIDRFLTLKEEMNSDCFEDAPHRRRDVLH